MVLLFIISWKFPLIVFLFIASYHGQTALRVSQCGGSKVYPRFPKPSWFKRRVEVAGPSAASDLGDSCLRVLVNVERGCEYRGPLTPWGCEGDLLWEFFERGWDSYSVRITEVYHVLTPPPKAHDRYIFKGNVRVYEAHPVDIKRLRLIRSSAALTELSDADAFYAADLRDRLSNAGDIASWDVFTATIPMIYMPVEITTLILRLDWDTLVFRYNWSRYDRKGIVFLMFL